MFPPSPALLFWLLAAVSGRSAVWPGLERAEAVSRVVGLWFCSWRCRSEPDLVRGRLRRWAIGAGAWVFDLTRSWSRFHRWCEGLGIFLAVLDLDE